MNSTNWKCLMIYSYCILCSKNKTFLLSKKSIIWWEIDKCFTLWEYFWILTILVHVCTCKTYMQFLSAIYLFYNLNCYWGRKVHMTFHGKYNIFFSITKAENNNTTQEVRSLALSASLSPVQKVQQLQLLNGKLRSSLRRLYALQREKAKLQHRVRFL